MRNEAHIGDDGGKRENGRKSREAGTAKAENLNFYIARI